MILFNYFSLKLNKTTRKQRLQKYDFAHDFSKYKQKEKIQYYSVAAWSGRKIM